MQNVAAVCSFTFECDWFERRIIEPRLECVTRRTRQYTYHVVGEFTQHVLVRHDELLGSLAVGNVRQNAQGLLLHVRTVLALQNEDDRLHDLPAVHQHDQVDVRLRGQQIAQQTERLHDDSHLVIGQQAEHLVGAE